MAVLPSHKPVLAFLLVLCSTVIAQDPFITYNTSIPIGKSGFVRWDTNSFAGAVNLWLQELAPNSTTPQVPLDYSNTKGFFLWEAGSNLEPGQYFYQLQSVGGQGIIFKSNPLMILCSECPVKSSAAPPVTTPTSGPSGTSGGALPSNPASTPSASSQGQKLSVGAAAGIGVGGALVVVAFIALIFFLFRRARKRKQALNQPSAHIPPSTHHQSIAPSSPPPQFNSPYERPQEIKMGYSDPPPVSIIPNHPNYRLPSHELDSAALHGSPHPSAYQSQSGTMTPRRISSPTTGGIVAPQPRSPPPALSSSGFQYQQYNQVSPPLGGQRTPGSNPETGSYGFPSHDASPNPEQEALHFQQSQQHQQQQQQQQQQGAGSPDSQQHLFPRRKVGSPHLRT